MTNHCYVVNILGTTRCMLVHQDGQLYFNFFGSWQKNARQVLFQPLVLPRIEFTQTQMEIHPLNINL